MESRTATHLTRAAAAVLATAAIVLMLPTVAAAAAVRAIVVDPTTGPPLTTIKITGTGFCGSPCGPVSISVGSLHVADVDNVAADGTFTTFVRMPGTVRPGPVDVIASQTGSDGATAEARDTFTVTINQPAPTKYPPPSTVAPPGGLPAPPAGPTATRGGAATPATSAPTVAPGTGSGPSGIDSATSVATRPVGDRGPGGWPWIVLAAVVVVGLAAAAWWVRRRSGPDRADTTG